MSKPWIAPVVPSLMIHLRHCEYRPYVNLVKPHVPVVCWVMPTRLPSTVESTFRPKLTFQAGSGLYGVNTNCDCHIDTPAYLNQEEMECFREKVIGYGDDATSKSNTGQLCPTT